MFRAKTPLQKKIRARKWQKRKQWFSDNIATKENLMLFAECFTCFAMFAFLYVLYIVAAIFLQ